VLSFRDLSILEKREPASDQRNIRTSRKRNKKQKNKNPSSRNPRDVVVMIVPRSGGAEWRTAAQPARRTNPFTNAGAIYMGDVP